MAADLTETRGQRAKRDTKAANQGYWYSLLAFNFVLTLAAAIATAFVPAFDHWEQRLVVGLIAGVLAFVVGAILLIGGTYCWYWWHAPTRQRNEARGEAARLMVEIQIRDLMRITVRPEHDRGALERVGIRVLNLGADAEFAVHVDVSGLVGGPASFYGYWDGDGTKDMRALPHDGEDIAWLMRRSTWDSEEGKAGYARMGQQRVQLLKVAGQSEERRVLDGRSLALEIKVLRKGGNSLPLLYIADFQKDSGNIHLSDHYANLAAAEIAAIPQSVPSTGVDQP